MQIVNRQVGIYVVPRHYIGKVWPTILPGVRIYREKSPHYLGTDEEVRRALSSKDGDDLVVLTLERSYAGFLTFRVGWVEGECWGTLGMIYLTRQAQEADILPEAGKQLEEELRSRGCTVMNYMTARKGFRRLAPKLGFRSRLVEWMKEI